MPEHQRVQKRSQKIRSIQDKRKICRKRAWRQEKKCGKSEKKLSGRRSASHYCWTKVDKNRMADAEVEAELQGLQAGEERRGSNASQTGDSCWRPCGSKLLLCVLQWSKPGRCLGQCGLPRVQGKWSSSGADARKR